MTSVLQLTQLAIGGQHHYIEIIDKDGTFVKLINVLDDTHANNQTYITGVAFNPNTKDLFSVSTPNLTQPMAPHDICWMPDDSGVLVALVTSPGSLEFRQYDYDGHLLQTWDGMDTDIGWTSESVKIGLTCDAKTVYYTDSMLTIFKYDLSTSSQLPFYEKLPEGSTSRYSGLAVLPTYRNQITVGGLEIGDSTIVATTNPMGGATGPYRAVCIGSDFSIWTDEINPSGSYQIIKKNLSDGIQILSVVTRADAGATNDITLSLACNTITCVDTNEILVWTWAQVIV